MQTQKNQLDSSVAKLINMESECDLTYYIQKSIKSNLEIIVLSMLRDRPMCGYDLIKYIFDKYNIFLSQGTVYPLLYSLKEEGILRAEYERGNMRTKIYSITDEGIAVVEKKLEEFIRAEEYILNIIKGD